MSENSKLSVRKIGSPLAVISLFISLTELVTGIAITQASGGVQIALTCFVIIFPFCIASIFFYILWHKNYVYYPPTEFGKETDVHQYVNAMQGGSLDESKIMELVRDSISDGLSTISDSQTEKIKGNKSEVDLMVTKASKNAIKSFKSKVITIDSTKINGKSWVLPNYPNRSVQDFLDSIWSELKDEIMPYQYGKTWILKKLNSKADNVDYLEGYSEVINRGTDNRLLVDAGILQGDQFNVYKI